MMKKFQGFDPGLATLASQEGPLGADKILLLLWHSHRSQHSVQGEH